VQATFAVFAFFIAASASFAVSSATVSNRLNAPRRPPRQQPPAAPPPARDRMFDTLRSLIPRDPDLPARAHEIAVLRHVLDGTLYDALPHEFHTERGPGGEYIPLRLRRPSVRYNLCRVVVEDAVALLFSDSHFPTIDSPDAAVRAALADLIKDTRLNEVMIAAAVAGSVGSVALWLRVLRGRAFVSVLDTVFLTPEWRADAPDELARVTERYKVPGRALAEAGYTIAEPEATHWFQRVWDEEAETWFLPHPVGAPGSPAIDPARSVRHGLGFVPIVWVRNLPGPSSSGDAADGACTFRPAIETAIEIDYQLSQAGRGLKYASDPTLLIKEPAAADGKLLRGAANALVVSEKGDAKLLEIGGTATQAVIAYVRTLREFALESMHGSRASAERLAAAQSGRALELMNQGLIWLADRLRVSYGEGALLTLARMLLRASRVYPLRALGAPLPPLDPAARLSLKWPRWYAPSAEDRERDARTLATLAAAGHISRESAVQAIADTYDIADVPAEIARIAAPAAAAATGGQNV